jgi:photosystem II stability/assembly factor-like uncharacterized protein
MKSIFRFTVCGLLFFLLAACNAPTQNGATQPAQAPTVAVAAPPVSPVPATPTVPVATATPRPILAATVSQPQFTSIHMLTEMDGWGITNDVMLRTNDGGASWHNLTPTGLSSLGFGVGSTFLNDMQAFIVKPDETDPIHAGTLYRTSDGGLTWSFNSVPFGGGHLVFLDASNGWIMADLGAGAGSNAIAIFQTTDGGATWTQTFINDPNASGASDSIPLSGIKTTFQPLNMQTAWVGGVVYSDGTVYLYRTDDSGHNWTQVTLPLPIGAATSQPSIADIQFPTPTDGFVSMTVPGDTTNTALYVTHDAGTTWTLTPTLISNGSSLDFVSAFDGFIFNGKQFYVTHDAGQTWLIVAPDVVFDSTFMSMDFVNASTGWIVTSDPATSAIGLYETTDSGETWMPQ